MTTEMKAILCEAVDGTLLCDTVAGHPGDHHQSEPDGPGWGWPRDTRLDRVTEQAIRLAASYLHTRDYRSGDSALRDSWHSDVAWEAWCGLTAAIARHERAS